MVVPSLLYSGFASMHARWYNNVMGRGIEDGRLSFSVSES